MSEHSNSEYYADRASAERRLAQAAADPRAGAAHAELAARYEALSSDPSLELPALEQPAREMPSLRSAAG